MLDIAWGHFSNIMVWCLPDVVAGCSGPWTPASGAASVCCPSHGASPGPRRSPPPRPQAGAETTEPGGRPAEPACPAAPPADPADHKHQRQCWISSCFQVFSTHIILILEGYNRGVTKQGVSAYSERVAVLLERSDRCFRMTDVHCVASALCVGQPQQQGVEGFMELLHDEGYFYCVTMTLAKLYQPYSFHSIR